jgi:hypothetical protein
MLPLPWLRTRDASLSSTACPVVRDGIGALPKHPVVKPREVALEAVFPQQRFLYSVAGAGVHHEQGGHMEPLQRSKQLSTFRLRHRSDAELEQCRCMHAIR